MRVLLVHSGNAVEGDSEKYTFVKEQGEALAQQGVEIDYYAIMGKGWFGYLNNYRKLLKKIKLFHPDIVHAHYGLSGALCVLQRKAPVVITCHNGETLTIKGNFITSLAIKRAKFTICVAQHIYDKLFLKPRKYIIQPCGVDLKNLHVVPKREAQKEINLSSDNINILFGGAFSNTRKNVALAKKALDVLGREDIKLIEMKGYTRQQVTLLYCGCDMLLLPTRSEGSPQVLKEAMACNCPIVATDVADIAYLLHGVENSYVTSFDPEDVAEKINKVIASGERSNGFSRIIELRLDNANVARTIIDIYNSVIYG